MAFEGRVWGAGKGLLLVGGLAATFFMCAGIAMRIALRAQEVDVPALTGRTVGEASNTLGRLGLTLRVDERRQPDAGIPAGAIMQQDPEAGSTVRRQRSVRVWISAGARRTTVPALVGQSERTAGIRLQQEGVALGVVSAIGTPDDPADAVVAQNPSPSTLAPAVALLVNRGDQTALLMPDVVGMEAGPVVEALRARGLRVSLPGMPPGAGVPAGFILRQRPAAGYRVSRSDATTLEVSR